MKYYVVADPHGFYTELVTALKEKGFFNDKGPRKLIICGDMFDRGEEAVKMQEFIVSLLEKDEVILVRGNHEDLMEKFVADFMQWAIKPVTNTAHWHNGTVQTVMQLAGMDLYELTSSPFAMKYRMENTPLFQKILPKTVNYFETEHYIFVHGWVPCSALKYPGGVTCYLFDPDWRGAGTVDWTLARWYNGMEAARQGVYEPNKTIVCGHWRCSYGHAKIEGRGEVDGENADYSPYYGEGVIALDACTVLSRKVNCIVIED